MKVVLERESLHTAKGKACICSSGNAVQVCLSVKKRSPAIKGIKEDEKYLFAFALYPFSSSLFKRVVGELISILEDEEYCDSSERGEADAMAGKKLFR